MVEVFVSYSRWDSHFVTRLTGAESSSRQVWVDTAGIEHTAVGRRRGRASTIMR
jgi:hypothetical protein